MNRTVAGNSRSSPVFARPERADSPAYWPDISVAAPAGAWCDQRLVQPGLDAVLPGRLIALAASWTAQAQTFAARFGGRRQRVLTTATQQVPAANLSTVTVSNMLDWFILC